jgi:hypothetical protein
MPIFLDRHDLKGVTAADIAEAHRRVESALVVEIC